MAEVRMTLEEYQELVSRILDMGLDPITANVRAMEIARASGGVDTTTKPKKRKTRYQAAYSRNFNKVKSNYTKKDGTWKKGGFKRAVKEAHRMTRKQLS